MMKAVILACCFAILVVLPAHPQEPHTVSPEELEVYAAVLDHFGGMSRPLIADETSTFECGGSPANGFSMGGCNGLRMGGETESQRMMILTRDLPDLNASEADQFIVMNQKSARIEAKIPTSLNYHMFSDQNIPASWKYSSLVYFSRAVFNPQHTQALVYVGILSANDASMSRGQYLTLKKVAGKWIPGGSSAVWQLQ